MIPHDCKKPFLCSCEVEELAEKTSNKMMEVVKEHFEQRMEPKKSINMNNKNLEQIVQQIPEAKRILDLSWRNSEKDGIGRKYGELSVKELESFTKAIIRHTEQRQETTSD